MRKILPFVVWWMLLQAPVTAQVAAKVISIQGRAEILRGGAAPWVPLVNLQDRNIGDSVRTLAQSRAVLILADETQLKLNSNTTLELRDVRQTSSLITRVVRAGAAQASESLLNLGAGEIWLRSKRQPAAVRVNTPAVSAAIRGTEFNLRVAQDGESVLTMLEGLVDFSNPQGAILVASGEEARARIGQAPTKTVLLRPRDAVQWVLYYPGAVSPADYPLLGQSEAQLLQTVEQASSLRRSAPGDIENLRRLARAQHDLRRLKEAEETLAAALAVSPGDIELLTDLAWVYLETDRPEEAVRLLESRSVRTDRATVVIAMAHYARGAAQQFFETIRRVDPSSSGLAATQRAFSEMLYGDIVEAKRILEGIPATDRVYALSRGLLSNVLLAQNNKDQALLEAQRAVQSGPGSPSAHLDLSLAQQSHFRLPEALESARRALALDPGYVQAQLQVARLLFAQGDTAQAERIARQGHALHADDPGLNALLGFILLAQAKTAESISFFDRSIAGDSTRGEPHLGLGIAAMRQGRGEEAIQSILIASTLEPQISLYQSF